MLASGLAVATEMQLQPHLYYLLFDLREFPNTGSLYFIIFFKLLKKVVILIQVIFIIRVTFGGVTS